MTDRIYVGVIGPSAASPAECDLSRAVGALLADAGAVLVTGSVAGVSGAAAAGATGRGGTVLALAPGYDRVGPDLTVSVPTGLGELSNGLVVRAADALVSVGGGWGTLMEVALARRTGVPVMSLLGWQVRDAHGAPVEGPVAAPDPAAAVELALAAARSRGTAPRLG
jgi:uncharacterized protein (TIGR00725 family)